MRRLWVLFAFVSLFAPSLVLAQDAPQGIRGELITSMMEAGGKIEELSTAIPDRKYTWKPSKDVRSTGQVFLHVVQLNYLLPTIVGVKSPMPMDELEKLDSETMEPTKIRQMLKDSYAWASKAVADTPDADLDTQVDFSGRMVSKRAVLLQMASHSHEHLGQLIGAQLPVAVLPGQRPAERHRQVAGLVDEPAERLDPVGGLQVQVLP